MRGKGVRTSKRMSEVISRLAKQYGLDLNRAEQHVRLEQEGYLPLVVETVGLNQVSVCHYAYQNGDALQDPEIVFFRGYGDEAGWLPLNITQLFGGYRTCGTVKTDGSAIEMYRFKLGEEVAEFADMWAENIKAQGWLEPERVKVSK